MGFLQKVHAFKVTLKNKGHWGYRYIYIYIRIYTCTDKYTYIPYINMSIYIYISYLWVHVRNGVIQTSEPAGFEGHNNKLQLRTFQTKSLDSKKRLKTRRFGNKVIL